MEELRKVIKMAGRSRRGREEFKHRVEQLVHQNYPGSSLQWDDDPLLAKPAGTLIWDGFRGRSQLDRQRELGSYLRSQLGEDKVLLGVIFAFTPDEQRGIQEA
jgi:hypothetical protein